MPKQERTKMSLNDRAKQFAPFDALKGLRTKLRLVEYEHERVEKGDVSEEKAKKISDILLNLNKKQVLKVTYYCCGHYMELKGNAKFDIEFNTLDILGKKIELSDIYDIDVIEN